MTTAQELALIDSVLKTYRDRMAAIVATVPVRGTVVLSWGDGRFLRLASYGASITGYENATLMSRAEAAAVHITDGAHVKPKPVPAGRAKVAAINTLQKVIDQVAGQKSQLAKWGPSCPWPKQRGEDGPIVDLN